MTGSEKSSTPHSPSGVQHPDTGNIDGGHSMMRMLGEMHAIGLVPTPPVPPKTPPVSTAPPAPKGGGRITSWPPKPRKAAPAPKSPPAATTPPLPSTLKRPPEPGGPMRTPDPLFPPLPSAEDPLPEPPFPSEARAPLPPLEGTASSSDDERAPVRAPHAEAAAPGRATASKQNRQIVETVTRVRVR